MSNTALRIASGIVLLIGFLVVNFLVPDPVFVVFGALICALAMWEWARLAGVTSFAGQCYWAAAAGCLSLAVQWFGLSGDTTLTGLLSLVSAGFWLCVCGLLYLQPVKLATRRAEPWLLAVGVVVLVSTMECLRYLHQPGSGSPWLLLYALSLVWLMDSGAYFFGRRFGRHKLAPTISPGKTWEGVAGGVLVTVPVMAAVLAWTDLARGATLAMTLATLLAASLSVVGDLYESRLKRAVGLKDSSQLIPGHGGLLDRIDGVVASIPVFSFCLIWLS